MSVSEGLFQSIEQREKMPMDFLLATVNSNSRKTAKTLKAAMLKQSQFKIAPFLETLGL